MAPVLDLSMSVCLSDLSMSVSVSGHLYISGLSVLPPVKSLTKKKHKTYRQGWTFFEIVSVFMGALWRLGMLVREQAHNVTSWAQYQEMF